MHFRRPRLLVLLQACTAAQAVVIDDFNDPNPGDQTVVTMTFSCRVPAHRSVLVLRTRVPASLWCACDPVASSDKRARNRRRRMAAWSESTLSEWNGTMDWLWLWFTTWSGSGRWASIPLDGAANDVQQNDYGPVANLNSRAQQPALAVGFDRRQTDRFDRPPQTFGSGAFVLVLGAGAGFNFTLQAFSSWRARSSRRSRAAGRPAFRHYIIPFSVFSFVPALQCAGGVAAGCADFADHCAVPSSTSGRSGGRR